MDAWRNSFWQHLAAGFGSIRRSNESVALFTSGLAVVTTGLLLLLSNARYLSSINHARTESSTVSSYKRFHLYTNPLCPFANRVWIIITEYEATDKFTFTPIPLKAELMRARYLHQLPSWAHAVGANSAETLQELKDWYMENINKAGEVPSLTDDEALDNSAVFKESDVISEYLATVLEAKHPQKLHLFPSAEFSAEDIARFRLAIKSFPISNFYACLKNQDPVKDAELFAALCKGLGTFVSHMSPDGPFILGRRFTFADIYCIPFIVRFAILLPHYRGMDMFHPSVGFDVRRFKAWFVAASNRPSIKKTSPSEQEILRLYEGEAHEGKLNETGFHGRGRSKMESIK